MELQIIQTADGSHTFYNKEIDEHYHSTFGAIQESNHVFIKEGYNQVGLEQISIFEVGFGTGLNVFLTFIESKKDNKKVDYYSIELFPLAKKLIKPLNYASFFSGDYHQLFLTIHESPWNTKVQLSENFTLCKIQGDLAQFEFTFNFDLVYFDAFSPVVQPEMWQAQIFKNIYNHLNCNGILTTYSAKGLVKRNLREAGFKVYRIPGPPGKREMLRAIKLQLSSNNNK